MIFTAVRKYQKEHPRIVPCYTEMYDELSQILDVIYPYAYSESYIENEQQTINT